MRLNIHHLFDVISQIPRGGVVGYLLASGLVCIALALRFAIAPVEAGLPFLTFFPAVTLAAILGGAGPALYAIVISCILASYLFIAPFGTGSFTLNYEVIWSNLIFSAEELLIIIVIEAMLRQRDTLYGIANELRREQKRMRIMTNHVEGFASFMLDPDGNVASWNDSAQRLKGYSADEILGRNFACFYTPEDIAAGVPRAVLAKAKASGMYKLEGWRVRKDGSLFYVAAVISALYDEQERLTGFVKVNHDISEHHQYEQRLLTIIQSAPIPLLMVNSKGNIVLANTQAETLFAYNPGELMGKTIEILIPARFHDAHVHLRANYITAPENRMMGAGRELPGRRKDGSELQVEVGLGAVPGAERMVLVAIHDISYRKQIEAMLVEAKNKSDSANYAKSVFLANMSHEIRTPMNGLIGMLDVLMQTELSKPQLGMAKIIRESAETQLSILNDILDFSKIDAGKLELVAEPFMLEDVVESVCILLDQFAMNRDVDLKLFVDPRIPGQLQGDALRLRQILSNLTSNAIKFSAGREPMGEVKTRAELNRIENGRVWVDFIVQDNGIGMDSAVQSRIFERFEQADAATTRRFGGTGLGLPITLRLVELMGGEITLESALDQGSTFKVALQFDILAQPEEIKTNIVAGLTCIVIGDESGLMQDVARHLQHAGAEIIRTPNLETAKAFPTSTDTLWVWVLDVQSTLSIDELCAMANIQPADNLSLLVINHLTIGRGRRRKPRRLADNLIQIDGNLLTRYSILNAVAIAAGRAEIEKPLPEISALHASQLAVSREQALQQGQMILVAEDNDINCKVIEEQLRLLGYYADIVHNGAAALAKWRNGRYALLLTDCQMPEMDGYQLTAAIRQEEQPDAHQIIIAITANAMQGEAERCLSQGMDDYLSKPIRLNALSQMLALWLAPECTDHVGGQSPQALTQSQLQAFLAFENLPIWDPSILMEIMGDNPEMHYRLLQKFLHRAKEQMAEIAEAKQSQDMLLLANTAHTLKSSASSMGAIKLGEMCNVLEKLGKEGDALGCQRLTEQLLQVADKTQAAVAQYLERLGG